MKPRGGPGGIGVRSGAGVRLRGPCRSTNSSPGIAPDRPERTSVLVTLRRGGAQRRAASRCGFPDHRMRFVGLFQRRHGFRPGVCAKAGPSSVA